jgi:hypothetical protein
VTPLQRHNGQRRTERDPHNHAPRLPATAVTVLCSVASVVVRLRLLSASQRLCKPEVAGSIPARSTRKALETGPFSSTSGYCDSGRGAVLQSVCKGEARDPVRLASCGLMANPKGNPDASAQATGSRPRRAHLRRLRSQLHADPHRYPPLLERLPPAGLPRPTSCRSPGGPSPSPRAPSWKSRMAREGLPRPKRLPARYSSPVVVLGWRPGLGERHRGQQQRPRRRPAGRERSVCGRSQESPSSSQQGLHRRP